MYGKKLKQKVRIFMKLKIYETFASIQGESTYVGIPCFFIRLAQCNLRCSYCDTRRAQTLERAAEISVGELVQRAAACSSRKVSVNWRNSCWRQDIPC